MKGRRNFDSVEVDGLVLDGLVVGAGGRTADWRARLQPCRMSEYKGRVSAVWVYGGTAV